MGTGSVSPRFDSVNVVYGDALMVIIDLGGQKQRGSSPAENLIQIKQR
jgi:hypothetical protein